MAGSTVCGRVAHSPSSEEEDCPCNKYFEFIAFINNDRFGKKKLSNAFAKFLASKKLIYLSSCYKSFNAIMLKFNSSFIYKIRRQFF
jgi:hypothetical protein